MTDIQPAAAESYTKFFEKQRRGAETLKKMVVATALIAVAIVVALLFGLSSEYPVWIYATLLVAFGFYGLKRLRNTASATALSFGDLEEISRHLHQPRPRDDVIAFIATKKQPDESNVPEALYAYASAARGNESVSATANAAFAQPTSELSMAGFFRTALVLGGLFGTVLFFAIELAKPGILGGDLTELLPGLRGALASTLTGILGSVAIGIIASRSEQILERGMWETESFLAGPLSAALATVLDRPVQNETDLWQSLVSEVVKLRQGIEQRHTALADDVAAHAVALQAVSDRLSELPQIVVPPQLQNLHESAAEFRAGMVTLQKTAETLVAVVQQVGVFAPTKTLEQLNAVAGAVTSANASVSKQLVQLEGQVHQIEASVGAIPPALTMHATKVEKALSEVHREVIASGQRVSSVHLAVTRDEERTVIADTTAIRTSVDSLLSGVKTLTDAEDKRRGMPKGIDPDSPVTVEVIRAIVENAGKDLQSAIDANVKDQIQRLASSVAKEATLQQSIGKLRVLDGIAAWHTRAVKAPLMRLLLLGGNTEAKSAANKA